MLYLLNGYFPGMASFSMGWHPFQWDGILLKRMPSHFLKGAKEQATKGGEYDNQQHINHCFLGTHDTPDDQHVGE